ncbi:similar to Saccharomyces cerevisiae YLR100W ERG27 3-keto sterol reductase [Maudiozyma saulgeensis]|uniref:3beta-hydroxysteroid 3-dehydrogenase n=1 Tax=Maudiozyma saulgeensis TaxID=1789683 RepID=A0A1X7R7Q1_9SACH|nr:similar to Saccharomyces cerevisiae YLR100W ERG27 3-keto sterol reductase [Kazachstania saulgeensis]
MSTRKVAVITGTNSNLGINIAYRLIERESPSTRLTIVVTSRTLPRVREVIELLKKHVKKVNRVGLVDYDYILVDFTNMVSILSAYYELKKQYKAIHYLFINAAQGVYDGIDWFNAVKDVMMNPLDAVTYPTYKIQKVGVKSADGMGLVFQANVFGPYYFIHKILPLLQEGNAIIVWVSSIMSLPKYLSLQDMELLKSNASYEGSKRLVDLVHLGTYKEMKKIGIHQYVVHPGIFTSHSFFKFLNVFTYYGMLFLFYFARLLGSKWHNIDGYKAANAPVYVATLANPHFDNQDVKFGSATSLDGIEYIDRADIDPTGMSDVMAYMNTMTEEWDEKLKNQITNSRVPI